jgi:hypothetical protein
MGWLEFETSYKWRNKQIAFGGTTEDLQFLEANGWKQKKEKHTYLLISNLYDTTSVKKT